MICQILNRLKDEKCLRTNLMDLTCYANSSLSTLSLISLQTYLIGPPMSLFGPDITDDFVKFNNFRVYGTILLIIMGSIVFVGVKFVNKGRKDLN